MTLQDLIRRGGAYGIVMLGGTVALTLVLDMAGEEFGAIWLTFTMLAVLIDVVKQTYPTLSAKPKQGILQYFERIDE
jgi:hypothetical protein